MKNAAYKSYCTDASGIMKGNTCYGPDGTTTTGYTKTDLLDGNKCKEN